MVPAAGYGTPAGWDFAGPISRVAVGGHRREGIFATNHDVGLAETTSITEILPRVLEHAGFRTDGDHGVASTAEGDYSAGELEEMEARLRDLGYIE